MSYELETIFNKLRKQGRKALIPYFTALYPSAKVFKQSVIAAADAGADIIEIGLPFSDPLADGPVIQHSSHYALTHGFTVERMFKSIKQLRDKTKTPLVIMTYINPVLSYGVVRFMRECRKSGVSGLIIPDMIPEEGGLIEKTAALNWIAINYIVAPTTPMTRIRLIAARTSGFIYLVSVAGVTGERRGIPSYLPSVVKRIRQVTDKPVCIGFGISTPAQARAMARLCDGVIIGSALVKMTNPSTVRRFLKKVRQQL
ncbi:MAG: tryptophan synthase subunit alpha [Planctomycetes bacterium]|nr:tryptophan synthase subunit alpha [Planctomycetota bacterium]